ncbi:hypothetical protein BpHYR1_015251 [Brachionus plicatilis]|uniref:Uncharacterized protein n=1 Tax=Brachionus plicatilis TaxID=10195 RepID=A0A3M7Q4K5_BRAPC|nr:hypothetical protein BpHYR1_015251 [Brachionus plicatilis]
MGLLKKQKNKFFVLLERQSCYNFFYTLIAHYFSIILFFYILYILALETIKLDHFNKYINPLSISVYLTIPQFGKHILKAGCTNKIFALKS